MSRNSHPPYTKIFYDKRKRLSKNKYALINLSTKSADSLEPKDVEDIVKLLLRRGYEVFENTKGPSHFPGVKPISPSLYNLVSFSSNASLVISVRSGLLDLVAQTNASILAIHTINKANDTTLYMKIAPLSYWRGSAIRECVIDESEKVFLEFANG